VDVPKDDQLPSLVMNLSDDLHPFTPARIDRMEPMRQETEKEIDLIERVKFALRGRWIMTVALALLCGVAAAYIGWGFKAVTYRSEGTMRIPYLRPKVLQGSEADQPMVLFDSMLTAQAQRIKGREIVDAALQTPAWKKTGRGNSEKQAVEFLVHVTGEHSGETELIKVSYVDPDPAAAAAGVNAVFAAFSDIYTKEQAALDQQKMQSLENRRRELTMRLGDLVTRMEREMPPLPALAAPQPLTSNTPTTRPTDTLPAPMASLDEQALRTIAKTDEGMRAYLDQQEQMQDVLARMKDVVGDNHPDVARKTKELERFTTKVYQYAAQYRPPAPPPTAAAVTPAPTVAQALPTQPTREMVLMSPTYESLKTDARTVHDELNETIRRIENLRMENGVGQRVNVIARGEVPVAPYSDSRMKMAAVAGGAGAALPVAVLILLGLLGQTYRFSTDAEDTATETVPLLGILPILSDRLDEMEKRADAAHCVHQIRAILQMRRPTNSAYMVTSAAAGEGKTSLTAALAFAFAASGARTLLVDADLVGQRLTGGFHSDRQLGLLDAINGAALGDCVKRIERGLRFMPVGKTDTTLAAWTLSAMSIRKILAEARRHFDVVLVDTGPVLGSVEASVVAPEVDGVIFTIARGQQRWLVEKATKHVQSVGGKLLGYVFNRAESRDFNRSAFRSSARSSTMPQEPDWTPRREAPEAAKLGPLVTSVATLLPAHAEENGAASGNGNSHN
jgi:capsular exopolysaccharide synthesis family protein